MKAMIFAAGIGSRLRPFTLSHPKALVEVAGEPMLGRVIHKLIEAGVTDMVVNVHHFASQITDYLAANNNFGIRIAVSDESCRLLDTGGGLLKAAPLLGTSEPVIVHNADILTDFDLRRMADTHIATGADATLLVSERKSSRCLYFDRHMAMHGWGNLTTGATKPAGLDTSALMARAFGGVHIINPATIMPALAAFAPDDVFSIIDFYVASCRNMAIMGYQPADAYTWYDVGRPETLAQAITHYSK